jgi:hypothetical protein
MACGMSWSRSITASLLLAYAVVACGCQGDPFLPAVKAQALFKIKVGMSRDEIVGQIGQPHKQETFGTTEFLTYRTDFYDAATAQTFSPIAIVDGKVVGLGKGYYDNFVKQQAGANKDTTATKPDWTATTKP